MASVQGAEEKLVANAKLARWLPGNAPHAGESTAGLQDMLRSLPKLDRVVEVGSYRGISTEVFALMCGEVTAVDPWEDCVWHGVNPSRAFEEFCDRVVPYPNVKVLHMSSARAAEYFADESLDLVYIDACHDYESVRDDIAAWLPKIRQRGWISGHDYVPNYPGVIQAVDERFGSGNVLVFSDTSWLARKGK